MKKIFLLFVLMNILSISFSQEIVRLVINSNPQGAEIKIDGNVVGKTPLNYRLRRNQSYQIIFSLPGYKSQTMIYKGGSGDINVNLQPEQTVQTQQSYILNVKSNINGAAVFANNTQLGVTPLNYNLQVGIYNITVSAPGYRTYTTTINHTNYTSIFAQLDPEIINYPVSINSTIQGADLYINGQLVGKTPYSTSLPAGMYQIMVKMAGYKDYSTSLNVTGMTTFTAQLESMFYKLTINSNINQAEIYIQDQLVGKTPTVLSLGSGTYNIKVKAPNYKEFSQTVNLNGDSMINAILEEDRYIFIVVPLGSKIFLNNIEQNLTPIKIEEVAERGKPNDRASDKARAKRIVKWATYQLFPIGNLTTATIRIETNDGEVERTVEFKRQTLSLRMSLE